jgi:membrane protease YdiL (CAAX protease family)
MTFFAFALTHTERAELQTVVKALFILCILVSFICVAAYSAKQIRIGQLFPPGSAPMPIVMQPMSGWLFVVSVVGLIYLQSALYAIIVLVGICGMLAETRRSAVTQFGLDRLKAGQALTWSLLVFGALMLVETPLTDASAWILDELQMPHPDQQSVETFRQYNDAGAILRFVFMAVLLFPVIEELFFRGFLLTFLKNYTSTWGAIILSAGIFAFAHLNLGVALPLWFLGIVLGIVYEHTGSLVVPIGIHACFNLATALNLLIEKGSS